MNRVVVAALVALVFWAPATLAEENIGIFETLLESSVSFSETTDAIESALAGAETDFVLHASHVVRVPDDMHQAKVYVLTSPAYAEAAAGESPRTISAQVLRVAVFTSGDEQKTFVNMANPVAHAMVFYARRFASLRQTYPAKQSRIRLGQLGQRKSIASSTAMVLPR